MKGAIYMGSGDVQIVDLPDPKPQPTDVVVKIAKCGICGSDVAEYKENGGAITPKSQFGHEYSGTIVEVGRKVKGINPGMRVTVVPINASPGGLMTSAMIGGFAQYALVQNAAVGYNIYPLPDTLTFDDGALVEPFAVGMHGVNVAQPEPKDRVLIIGAGLIGLSALAGMKARGVKDVVVSDISELRLQKAKEIGASAVHNAKETPLDSFLEDYYGETCNPFTGLVNVVVDAAGIPSVIEEIVNLVAIGGRISIVAVYKDTITLHPLFIMSKALAIKGAVAYENEFRQVINFIESGKANLRPVITHRYPLDEIDTALKVASNVNEAVKVMIDIPA